MFEDIDKQDSVENVIKACRAITNLIYNHDWLLASMREFCGGDIIEPTSTRFATNYAVLDSLLKKKSGLKMLFLSGAWAGNKLSCTQVGKEIESRVLDNSFWDSVRSVVNIYEPIYTIRRIVDSEVVPTMALVYDLFNNTRNKLSQIRGQEWVLKIVQNQWDETLSCPLHSAGKTPFQLLLI